MIPPEIAFAALLCGALLVAAALLRRQPAPVALRARPRVAVLIECGDCGRAEMGADGCCSDCGGSSYYVLGNCYVAPTREQEAVDAVCAAVAAETERAERHQREIERTRRVVRGQERRTR